MVKNRVKNARRQPGRRRAIAIETLGSRIALSASGFSPLVVEMNGPPSDHEAIVEHVRDFDASGEFTTLQQAAWQSAAGQSHVPGWGDGPGWRQPQIFAAPSELQRPVVGGAWGVAEVGNRMVETRVIPANVQVSGTNLVLPGLLVSRGDALTLVISASPMFGLPVGSQFYSQGDDRMPLGVDRGWTPKPLADLAAQRVAADGDANHGGEHQAVAGDASFSQTGGPTLPPRMGDPQNFVSTTLQPGASETRISGVWVADTETGAESRVELKAAPAQAASPLGQWAISKTDLDEGLIELESPLTPRRRGRRLPGESLDETSEQHDGWTELQALAERVLSAWDEAWREFGGENSASDRDAEATKVAQDSAASFNADVVDGLVELAVDGGVLTETRPPFADEQLADHNTLVRIDAGIAIYQEFEIATAADAAPPATARRAEPKADEDEHAEAESPAQEQPISAAAVGAGLLIGLPFSLRRRRQDDDDEELQRLRTT